MNDLAKQLRARRELLGISQMDLANQLDTTQSAISNYETGRGGPSMRLAHRAADALGCDVRLVPRDGAR
jgi:transcriptional regulator with XRE-family HTH domain